MSKSHVYASYFTISIAANKLVTVTNKIKSFPFLCNGKQDFQIGTSQTTVCTRLSGSEWKLTGRSDSKEASISVWNISSDGKMLKTRSSERLPDGTKRLSEKVFMRRGGGNGFVGQWQDAEPFMFRPKIVDVALSGHRLHLAYPDTGQYSDSPLDGSAVPINGPLIRSGYVICVNAISPQKFRIQVMLAGRVVREGTLEISQDDHTMLQESWAPENLEDKDRLIYDKQ